MSRQDDNRVTGNDGSWFLEAVGAASQAPKPSDTVAALEIDNMLTDGEAGAASMEHTAQVAAFDGGTGTSTSTYERPIEPDAHHNSEMDASTPAATPPSGDDPDLNPVLRSRRSFRWPAVAFGIFLIAVAALAALWLPAALKQDAVEVKQAYADAALSLRQELPVGQSALDVITDPSSTPEAIAATVPEISQLDSAAHELAVAAAKPLPRQLPIFPVEEIAALRPLQDAAQIHAAQGSDIARNLGYSYVYRTTIPQLLAPDDLPTTADVQTINALSVALASSLVDDADALSDLPITEATADLNAQVHAAVERYAFWQDEYLTALSEGDEATAATLVDEMGDIKDNLDEELGSALATARVEIDLQIVELAGDLESYLQELTR
jgi:hypothetical protein